MARFRLNENEEVELDLKGIELLQHAMLYMNPKPGFETFVAKGEKPDEHFTLQVLHGRRILDLHKAVERGAAKEYETLFQISFHKIARVFVAIRNATSNFQASIEKAGDPISWLGLTYHNPGWFRRKFMVAMPASVDVFMDSGLFRSTKGGKKLRFAKDTSKVKAITIYRIIGSGLKEGNYILLKSSKDDSQSFAGLLIVTDGHQKRFLYLSKRSINRFISGFGKPFAEQFLQMNIPGTELAQAEVARRFKLLGAYSKKLAS